MWNLSKYSESSSISITSSLLVIVLPIVPIPSLLLFTIIHLLLVTVTVLLIQLRLLLLPLRPLQQVLVFKLSHLLEGHRRLIRVLLPNLSDQTCPFLWGSHALMDLLLCWDFPYLDFRYGLIELLFMLGFSLRIFLDRVLVVEDSNFLFNISELGNGLVDAQNEKIFNGLPLVAFLLYLLKIFVSVLHRLLLLHRLDQLLSGRTVRRLLWLVSPNFEKRFREDLLILRIKLVHQL